MGQRTPGGMGKQGGTPGERKSGGDGDKKERKFEPHPPPPRRPPAKKLPVAAASTMQWSTDLDRALRSRHPGQYTRQAPSLHLPHF
uniref:Uncharacterized protein n=1 Tax=Oryza glaberrima TaxID=4538 RepID=I1QM90_ORYGL